MYPISIPTKTAKILPVNVGLIPAKKPIASPPNAA
jgi:hypothetical protein